MTKTARAYASSITTFDFFVTLVVVQVALHPLVPLSAMLQDKEIDLTEAVTERTVVTCIEQLRPNRNDDVHWDDLFQKATVVAASVNEVPYIPREAARRVYIYMFMFHQYFTTSCFFGCVFFFRLRPYALQFTFKLRQ